MEANGLRQLISTGPAELLIASIWQGLLLTALAWFCLALAPRLGAALRASTRFTLWLIVFLLVALLPVFAIAGSMFGAQPLAVATPQADFSLHLNVGWAFAIEGLWALASLWSLMRLMAAGRQMLTLLRNSAPVALSALDGELQSILARGDSRPVEIRLSDTLDAPSVIGFFHPAVVVPSSLWRDLGPADLKQIILHEMAHLDRGDDWTNLLQKLLRALSPLNPALFWAERHLCLEREQACDDAVLDAAGNARAYATCLTNLAETRLVKRAASLAPGLWKRHSELAARVENILHRRHIPGPLFSRGLIAASLLGSLAAVTVLERCPGIVTFAGRAPLATQSAAQPAHFASQALPTARYQQAVFHPTLNGGAVLPGKRMVIPNRPHRRSHPAYASGGFRLLELRSIADEGSEGITFILFTVEVPQTSTDPNRAPRLSMRSSWIAFQI